MLRTPVVLVTLKDKSELEFFTERDYKEWEATTGASTRGWSMKYFKGLSSWKTPQFAKFLQNPDRYLFALTHEDKEDLDAIDLAFNASRAADRREWLVSGSAEFEDFIQG